jgi:hypothetical protein
MTRKDLTLLAIAFAAHKPLQPVQLQKSVFLICQNLSAPQLGIDRLYEFEPYDYGPFCSEVYRDADKLESEGLVTITRPPESDFKLYRATGDGVERAQELGRPLSPEVRDYVKKAVGFTQGLSFNQLVSAIYRAYPNMRLNSVFQE